MQLPTTMKALVLHQARKLLFQEIDVPKPLSGEVLIRVIAAPINPSDMIFMERGEYQGKSLPCVAGFQGSGVVVESGGGIIGWGLVNKKVAFSPLPKSGSYAQFAIAAASQCLPVDDDMSYEAASMSFVNPLTAVAMVSILKEKKAKGVVVTAAASALGRMLNRLLAKDQIPAINIVRRQEQAELLTREGCKHVLNSSDVDFQKQFTELVHQLNIKVCFDAIGGSFSGLILKNMPRESILYVYGALSEEQTLRGIDIGDIIYNKKVLTGLFLPNWLESQGTISMFPMFIRLRGWLMRELRTEIARQYPLELFMKGVLHYRQHMTQGKVIFKPWDTLEQCPVQVAEPELSPEEIQRIMSRKVEGEKKELPHKLERSKPEQARDKQRKEETQLALNESEPSLPHERQ